MTRWTRKFKVNGETREFMYLYSADTKQEILDFLNEFCFHYNQGDLYKITHSKRYESFTVWDARS